MSHTHVNGISIVIVNYRSADALRRCLSDLAKIAHTADTEVIVVNNDTKPLLLTAPLPLRIVEVNHNIGFGAACNRGLAHATKTHTLFLNPDTHSFSENFLSLTTLCADDATIASPAVCNTDGSPQAWSCGDTITLPSIIINNLRLSSRPWHTPVQHAPRWVSGAALCGSTTFLRRLGGFDEGFFLYFEDVDLCERAHAAGGRVVRDPSYTLFHSSGASTTNDRIFQKTCYYTSQDRFIRKHRGPLQAHLLRILRAFHSHA